MRPLADCLSDALDAISGIDTTDASSLAYVSGLLALQLAFPGGNSQEIDFSVLVGDNSVLTVDTEGLDLDHAARDAINIIATHYFQSVRCNLPLLVH